MENLISLNMTLIRSLDNSVIRKVSSIEKQLKKAKRKAEKERNKRVSCRQNYEASDTAKQMENLMYTVSFLLRQKQSEENVIYKVMAKNELYIFSNLPPFPLP